MGILENNRLIAEFMGGKEHSPLVTNYKVFQFEEKIFYALATGSREPSLEYSIAEGMLNFHNDWNRLMPVIEKINNLLGQDEEFLASVTIHPSFCKIEMHSTEEIICNKHGENLLRMTYWAVVEFINWYNQQKK